MGRRVMRQTQNLRIQINTQFTVVNLPYGNPDIDAIVLGIFNVIKRYDLQDMDMILGILFMLLAKLGYSCVSIPVKKKINPKYNVYKVTKKVDNPT